MRHAIVMGLLLALAGPGAAAAQTMHGERKQPANVKRDPSKQPPKKTPEKGKPTPGQISAVAGAKSVFIFAMETCNKPERCDPSLRDDAERRFLDACRECASAETCEAERDAIREGSATRRTNPCVPEKAAAKR